MRLTKTLLAGLALATAASPAFAMGERPSEPSSGGSSSTGSYSTPVPEPGMFGIFGLTLVGLAIARRRRKL